jgi:hypothetical protein
MKALNRLIYTISNQNKPNQNDVDALNELIEYKNNEDKRTLVNNELFAKLFIGVFKSDLIKSKGNYQSSLFTLKTMLKIDIHTQYDSFYNEINLIEFNKLCEYLDITDPKCLDDIDKNSKKIKENAGTLAEVLNHYSKEKVYNRLNKLMIELIDNLKK